MTIETWQIEYDMQTPSNIVHVQEELPCRQGYHDRLQEWWEEYCIEPAERTPIYKVRRENVFELLSLGLEGARALPLEERADLAEGRLLSSNEHPIILTSPDGTRYFHTEF